MTETQRSTPFGGVTVKQRPPQSAASSRVLQPQAPVQKAANKPPVTAKNHPPPRGYPVAEGESKAAPLPVVQKQLNRALSGNGAAAPPGGDNLPPPHINAVPWQERHRLRGEDEYPAHRMHDTRFHIGRDEYPTGFDLQWIAVEVWQQPQASVTAGFMQGGWVPVETGDFDGKYDGRFVPRTMYGPICLEGLMLMARAMAWSDRARFLAKREAQAQVDLKVRQLQKGELDKVTLDPQHKSALAFNSVKAGFEGIQVPVSPDR